MYLKKKKQLTWLFSYRCTKLESAACAMNATSYHIIPPIVTAKLTTKHNLFFLYGQVEVIAKLPTGDWIVSGIPILNDFIEHNNTQQN